MKRINSTLFSILSTAAVALPAYAGRDYSGHHGYREHPYDPHRHYDHYTHGGHNYAYGGHWRSWNEWNDYYSKRPPMHKHGGYYYEHDHLMFRFCDPGSGTCVFFSIGR
jgi:hypothetical protein